MCSLIFFALTFFSCRQEQQKEISLIWDNNRAVAISIPASLLGNDAKENKDLLHVRVEKNVDAMLGNLNTNGSQVVFKPIVPLSRGLVYEIVFKNKVVGNIKVPAASAANASEVLAIYPSIDSLPENLLKIYIRFSKPMREGQSLKNIALLDHNNDTVPNVFLDLQPELWNKERTVLTVWLDPGRIKRELIPNQQLGNPLKRGENYTITVSNNWKDELALPLSKAYKKQFVVASRDSMSPDPANWKVSPPKAGTTQPLELIFSEPLDNFLLAEAIQIVTKDKVTIAGQIKADDNERKLFFTPAKKWQAGNYQVRVESILEDVAGNNLNRLFDRDIRVKNLKKDQAFIERRFEIRN